MTHFGKNHASVRPPIDNVPDAAIIVRIPHVSSILLIAVLGNELERRIAGGSCRQPALRWSRHESSSDARDNLLAARR
jgi:hypothetical protein